MPLGARNPLPLTRRAVALLPVAGPIPLALRDAAGARHPVQLVREGDGPALLVELELGALEATTFAELDAPVAGAWWEVSPRVLDNGRVRAELDAAGRIARLSWDGAFAEWTGPAAVPLVDGVALGGESRVSVSEAGPVRAVVTVERGPLELRYLLHAHEDALRVSARWRGRGALELAHPTLAQAICEGEGWLALTDGLGRGLAIIAGSSASLRVSDGCALVALRNEGERVDYALLAAQRPAHSPGLGQLAQSLTNGHAAHDGPAIAAPFRLVAPHHVVASDARSGQGWSEIRLREELGARAKVFIYPARPMSAAKVDDEGRPLSPVRATPEGDGLQVDLAPHESAQVRWSPG